MPSKKSVLPWIFGGCAVLIAGLVAFIVFIIFVVGAAIRSSEPYKTALAKAKSDSRVAAALGTPIEPGWFSGGSINVENDSGSTGAIPLPRTRTAAAFTFLLEGSRAVCMKASASF